MVNHDVETDGFQWDAGHRPFLHQFKAEGEEPVLLRPGPDNAEIQAWLDRSDTEGYMAWNSKFDLHHTESQGFTLPRPEQWHDAMLEAHAVDERRSLALKNVHAQLYGEEGKDYQKAVKGWLTAERARRKTAAKEAGTELIEPTYADVPPEIMEPYAAEDVIEAEHVHETYAPILERSGLKDIVEFERKVLAALYDVEKRGFPVQEEGYRKLEIEVVENLETLEDHVQELARPVNDDFNPNSPKQVYNALKELGADLTFVTGESMDKENLETVDHELARAILAFRSEYKVLSTYCRPMVNRHWDKNYRCWKEQFIQDEHVHANYRQVGARTGRMSCSDPNMQNQPRDDLRLRYNFVADPGHKFVVCDLSGVEFRIFAAYAGGGAMLDAIREGRDVHAETARLIGIRDRARETGVETARQRGKTYNFSQLYGGGLRTIRKQLRCSMDQARKYRDLYREAYPEIVRLQNRIEWMLQDQGYIRSAWGRRFRGEPRDAYKYTNYLVQGTAADLLKEALIRLHADGVPVVALIHDEIVAHVPIEDAEEAKVLIERALTDHPRISEKVPLEAEGVIVDRWSDAKPLKDGSLFVPNWAQS